MLFFGAPKQSFGLKIFGKKKFTIYMRVLDRGRWFSQDYACSIEGNVIYNS